jgi:hypothetical protein
MATILKHVDTGERYVLIGAGFGAYKSARPSLFGSLLPKEESGNITVVAVCNNEGLIHWIHSSKLIVVEIDGKPLSNFIDD